MTDFNYKKQLELTLAAIEERRWTVVLLEPGTKRLLAGRTWDECATQSPDAARYHLTRRHGGIGLDVAASGLVVLDFDDVEGYREMVAEPGLSLLPPPTSTSPSGGLHVYLAAIPDLPAQITWKGRRIGDIIRGPRQQVVLPPSLYPGNAKRGVPPGGHYSWLHFTGGYDPVQQPYEIPPPWRDYLISPPLPDFIELVDERDALPEWLKTEREWLGPSPEELIARATAMPRSKRRANGVKFRCPQCESEGHDRHYDNAYVRYSDGHFGCAYAPGDVTHRRAIARALGALVVEDRELERLVPDEVAQWKPFNVDDIQYKGSSELDRLLNERKPS